MYLLLSVKDKIIRKRAFFRIFFLFFFPLFIFANSKVRHVYLTWSKEDTSRTMTINVHTLENLDLIHLYFDDKSHEGMRQKYRYHTVKIGTRFLENIANRYLFQIELSNLDPGKDYFFIVGDPIHGYTEEKKFRTIPENAKKTRFVEGGDFEVTPVAAEIAKMAATYSPHAALFGGDYPRDAFSSYDYKKWDEWLDIYTQNMVTPDGYLIPMVMAIGNNEVLGGFDKEPEDCPFYYFYFPQNAENLSYFCKFFGKDIVLFILDSGHTAKHSGKQCKWLESTLSKHQNIPVKFASYHVPLYPSVRFPQKDLSFRLVKKILRICGMKEDPNKLLCPHAAIGRRHWLPLFDRFHLTCAFEHHDQTLKRTKFLRGGEEHPEGTLFLGDGGWGPLIQYTPIQNYFRSYFAKTIGHLSFFWLVEVSEEGIEYKAITKNGQIIDQCYQQIIK